MAGFSGFSRVWCKSLWTEVWFGSILFYIRGNRKITLQRVPVWIPDGYVDPRGGGFYLWFIDLWQRSFFFWLVGNRFLLWCIYLDILNLKMWEFYHRYERWRYRGSRCFSLEHLAFTIKKLFYKRLSWDNVRISITIFQIKTEVSGYGWGFYSRIIEFFRFSEELQP